MSLYSLLQLHPSLHLSSSFPHLLQVYSPLLSPPNNAPPPLSNLPFKSTTKCLIVMQTMKTAWRACLPFKASCSGIWLTLALRTLTQRGGEWMKGLGHFKQTHVFCQSLWLSWRSNLRAFRFKKGYFTSRPSGWLSCRRGKSRLLLKWLHLRGSDWSNRARRSREVSTSPVR